jgi:hypothetical protein
LSHKGFQSGYTYIGGRYCSGDGKMKLAHLMKHGDLGNLFNFIIIDCIHTYVYMYTIFPYKKMYPYTIFEAYKIVDNTMMSHLKHITHSFGNPMVGGYIDFVKLAR